MTRTGVRIAMWSGPRNISTAMMRSFGARPDTTVIDEPFYAAYLARTGLEHPMRAEVLASQPNDWRDVVVSVLGEMPGGRPVFYQKHMTHHMLPEFGREWMSAIRNAFLIRDPVAVLASYTAKRAEVELGDIGIVQQQELFEREAERLGCAPPVIESEDVLNDPPRALSRLCEALGIEYTDAMLTWPAGRRDTDGVWAPAWYHAVEQSTGFARPAAARHIELSPQLQRVADLARPAYEFLSAHRIRMS